MLQSLFHDRSIVLRFSIVALVVSVLLFISKASLFESSAIAAAFYGESPGYSYFQGWKYQ